MEKHELNSVSDWASKESASILERGKFGKTDVPLFWVEQSKLFGLARILREDTELSFDWLENVTVMQVDRILVATWFLRSRRTKKQLVLRSTAVPKGPDEPVDLPSIREVWPEGEALEREASEMFGIRFGEREIPRRLLALGFRGFPMRKSFAMKRGTTA